MKTATRVASPVLVLGSEPRIAVTIARSLHRRGIPVDVCRFGGEPDVTSTSIRRTFILPTESADAGRWLTTVVREQGYSYIMPTSDSALAAILPVYDELASITGLSCPPPDSLRSVLDKNTTLRVAREIGLPTPGTSLEAISGPIVVKPVDKAYRHPFKVRYFSSTRDYRAALAGDTTLGQGVMLQEFVPGDGVGVVLLMHQGECVDAFQHRRIRELPWSGGVAVVAVSEPPAPALYQGAISLLRALGWEGVAMVEFRHDPVTGRFALMEVNGRYFGSLSLSYLAGIDFPYHDWQLAHGETPTTVEHYRYGLRWRWSAGVLYRMRTLRSEGPPWMARPGIGAELLGMLRDFLPSTRDALWTWSDPAPALRETARAVAELSRGLLRSLLRRLVPAPLIRRLQDWRYMDPSVRWPLLRLQLRRALGLARLTRRQLPGHIRSVLFVCHGNIIRSAFSEAWTRQKLDLSNPGLRVQSAGLRAISGKPADPRAIIAAREAGIELNQHQAQPLTPELVEASDLIVVMDYLNEANFVARYPGYRSRLRMISECGGGTQADEVEDPYTGELDAVRECYRRLQPYLNRLVDQLDSSRT